ncbi:MAG TPA: class F sortase [Nocardioidaceae bacterium]|nr:class F sortase [Nocardioidaceae bacterium]
MAGRQGAGGTPPGEDATGDSSPAGSHPSPPARRRRPLLTILAVGTLVGCLVVGGGLVWWGSRPSVDHTPAPLPAHTFAVSPQRAVLLARSSLPSKDASTAALADKHHGSTGQAREVAATSAVRLRGIADQIAIPAIGARAPLVPETVAAGQMVIPSDPKIVGWLDTTAGVDAALGTTVVAGHINMNGVEGALSQLSDVAPGDVIVTTGPNGRPRLWAVYRVAVNLKANLPQEIFDQSGPRRLVVVTCAGAVVFEGGEYTYLDNVRVYAAPVTSRAQ